MSQGIDGDAVSPYGVGMELKELIQQGWADHDPKSAEVAERLEANVELVNDDAGAAGFMNLASHTIGDHLGDRDRARALCEAVVEHLGEEAGGNSMLFLTVARRLAGDEAAATTSHARMGEDPANEVRVGMLVAQGHMHAGDWDAAGTLYGKSLKAADGLPEGHAGERVSAVTSNNIASEVLNLPARSEAQAALMERAAHAARTYWLRIGNWVNDERGDYLLSQVHTALEEPTEGRMFAERGLQTILDNGGGERVDQAFLHLARAQACRDAGALDDQRASLAEAEALAKDFEGEGLVSWFDGELAKAR